MIIRHDDVPTIPEPEENLVLKRIIRREDHGPAISVTWVDLKGRHKRLVNHESDRVYAILSGEAQFVVGENAPGVARAGDYVFIPRGVAYELAGNVTYLVMNGPAYRPGADEYLE